MNNKDGRVLRTSEVTLLDLVLEEAQEHALTCGKCLAIKEYNKCKFTSNKREMWL